MAYRSSFAYSTVGSVLGVLGVTSSQFGDRSSTSTRVAFGVTQLTTNATRLSNHPMPTWLLDSGEPELSTPPGSAVGFRERPALMAVRNDFSRLIPLLSGSPEERNLPRGGSAARAISVDQSTSKGVGTVGSP